MMTKYDVAQIAGVALVVLGGQGAVRLLVDHGDSGLLGWLGGGFAVHLVVNLIAVVVGGLLAAWARARSGADGPTR
jgi:hypothetical protein